MSTYCRITGKSRGLPKPNYFPLLPPISPADAKRLCRITGKSYGLPTHHYIPVLVGFTSGKKVRSSADKISPRITEKSDGQEANHYYPGVEHTVLKDYKYIFPKWQTSVDLTKILESKCTADDENKFVYTVEERKCGLVFPGRLEAAVRDGDVSDVMLAKTSDTLLFKLRRGQSVEVDVEQISVVDGMKFYEGEGPNEETLQKRNKRKRVKNEWRRKIFEDKERVADDEEEKLSSEKQRSKRLKVKLSSVNEIESNASISEMSSWKSVLGDKAIFEAGGFSSIIDSVSRQTANGRLNSVIVENTEQIKRQITSLMNSLPEPINVNAEEIDLSVSVPGIIQQPNADIKNITGLPVITVSQPFKPLVTSGFNDDLVHAVKSINENKCELVKMAEAGNSFKDVDTLPKIEEIPLVVEQIRKATLTSDLSNLTTTVHNVNGLEVNISEDGSEKRFVPGEIIETSSGLVFVPGSAVITSSGNISFIPGFKVNTSDGEGKFLPGQIIEYVDEKTTDESSWVFVAGRTILTRDGEKFVQGQEISTSEGVKFLPGQTVLISNGPAFVPGQVVEDIDGGFKFVPGQVVTCSDGAHFVPGQFSEISVDDRREMIFVPGKTVLNDDYVWEFVPGQTMKTTEGKTVFVPGITTVIDNERSFVPGLVSKTDAGKEYFVPGVIANKEDGLLDFVPGMNISSAEGQKFVEGLVVKGDDGQYNFVAGRISKTDDVAEKININFEAATKIDDIVLHDVTDFALLADNILFRDNGSSSSDNNEIFGHMVQSSVGVEFFPGDDVVGLPAGKVVPGRLVRGKELQFIPGNMVGDRFVPGQIVITDKGEQFIPGQVIETNEGPKFVPGQVLETKSGPKFVPGQTVQTEEGPRFIPGQIVNTKAGPTFIPGQVIFTEEEGPRFVPGQVVDTSEGPRFVPGKVVETGDHVTFIPGQIVETEDGLKFVAPDLEDDPEGGCQFTVQGFEITPEELKMLQRNSISHALFHSFEAEPAIDSTMLQQLANAGMAIGREVPVDVPVIDIKSLPITEAACKVGKKLNVDMFYSVKLSHIFSNIQQLVENADDEASSGFFSEECEDNNLKILLNAVNEFSTNGENILNALADIMEEIVAVEPDRKLEIIDLLYAASTELVTKNKMRKPVNKLTALRQLIHNKNNRKFDKDAIATLVSMLPDEEYAVSSAFQHICQESPELIAKVFANVGEMLKNGVVREDKVIETIHRAIIKAVVETSEDTVQEVLHKSDSDEFKCLVLDAVGLAKALGMTDIANALVNVLSDAKSVEILARDKITLEVLKRLTIMRQLAGKRPHLGRALNELKLDPYSARRDPRLKELVRESAALMVVPEESLLFKSSDDVPASLLFGDNSLIMEDFMIRTRHHGSIFLILKRGLQAVIPREAAKSVLTGKVPYTVLDENGIHYFKPLHVFNALKLSRFATNRFSMYGYAPHIVKKKNQDDDIMRAGSIVSFEDMRKHFENGCTLTEEVNS